MHFLGLDLAWGDHRPTGVAVLDDGGRLVQLATVRTDDEVVAALRPWSAGACVAGIDAPLVVTNPTGNRPAEQALNRDFSRFEAGAHPLNTGRTELGDQPRGARVAGLLGLDPAPDATGPRRAIEVYPHPATVALFHLGRTLKYKNRPGRSLGQLRTELHTLVRLLEGLATAEVPLHLADHDGWRALVAEVEAAERKSELRVAEDQVDAVVCAYVAQLAVRAPGTLTTYGDVATGCIVTPTLPEGLTPSPRRRPQPEDPAKKAVREYAALQPSLRTAAADAVRLITGILDDAGMNYLTVTGRAKSVASFAAKLARTDLADPVEQMTDLIGVRVITYVHRDVAAVASLLAESMLVEDDRDMGEETAQAGRFGYASRHLQLRLDAEDRTAYPTIGDRQVQVQIRTVLQHAWAEFEHDIRYKGSVPAEYAPDFDRRFTLAAGLLELADKQFSSIRDTLQAAVATPGDEAGDDPRISPQELTAFLAGQYADAHWSRSDHYAWMAELVLEVGITSLAELAEVVRPVDVAQIDERMGYRRTSGAVRRLDDVLLSVYGERYIALRGNAHRVPTLRARWERLSAR